MLIDNKNVDSSFNLVCIVCGSDRGVHLKAHRNKENSITGFVVSCEACDLKDKQFGIWESETGKAII